MTPASVAAASDWPTLVTGACAAVWYLAWRRSSSSPPLAERSLLDSVRLFVERLGWPLAGPELAFELGLSCLVLLAVGALLVARDPSKRAAAGPWLGLATYALTSCALIVASRPDQFLTGIGTLDERMLILLDIERLMGHETMGLVAPKAA